MADTRRILHGPARPAGFDEWPEERSPLSSSRSLWKPLVLGCRDLPHFLPRHVWALALCMPGLMHAHAEEPLLCLALSGHVSSSSIHSDGASSRAVSSETHLFWDLAGSVASGLTYELVPLSELSWKSGRPSGKH